MLSESLHPLHRPHRRPVQLQHAVSGPAVAGQLQRLRHQRLAAVCCASIVAATTSADQRVVQRMIHAALAWRPSGSPAGWLAPSPPAPSRLTSHDRPRPAGAFSACAGRTLAISATCAGSAASNRPSSRCPPPPAARRHRPDAVDGADQRASLQFTSRRCAAIAATSTACPRPPCVAAWAVARRPPPYALRSTAAPLAGLHRLPCRHRRFCPSTSVLRTTEISMIRLLGDGLWPSPSQY